MAKYHEQLTSIPKEVVEDAHWALSQLDPEQRAVLSSTQPYVSWLIHSGSASSLEDITRILEQQFPAFSSACDALEKIPERPAKK